MSTQQKRFNIQAQPLISYYIERANGSLVPLIPVDQLPSSIRLQGIPRSLRPDQVVGLIGVGELPDPTCTFQVEDSPPSLKGFSSSAVVTLHHRRERSGPESVLFSNFGTPSRRPGTGGEPSGRGHRALPRSSQGIQEPSWRKQPDKKTTVSMSHGNHDHPAEPRSALTAILNTSMGSALAEKSGYKSKPDTFTPAGKPINQDDKEYCTHWIRTGECDYTQQGCRYKHVMPDLSTLRNIGFKSTPRWYVEEKSSIVIGARAMDVVASGVKTADWLKAVTQGSDEARPSSKDKNSSSSSGADAEEELEPEEGESRSGGSGKTSSLSVKSKTHSDRGKSVQSSTPSSERSIVEVNGAPAPLVGDLISFGEDAPTEPSAPAPTTVASPSPNIGEKQETEDSNLASKPARTPAPSPSKTTRTPSPKKGSSPSSSPRRGNREATRSSPNNPHHSSLYSSEPLPPSPKIAGKQKARLNVGRQQRRGLMASMHACGEENADTGRPRLQRPYRGRGGRFHLPVARVASSSSQQQQQ